jgi:hypothetical protein
VLTTPHQLHALDALWSLRRSWPLLRAAAAAVVLQPADGLHGRTYGSRHGTGGHSEGVLDALVADLDEQLRYQRLLDRVADEVAQACWLVRAALPELGRKGRPFPFLAAAIPGLPPATARDVAGYLAEADETIRHALRLDIARHPLVGVDCPGCMARMLEVHDAAPDRAGWLVVCAARCRCRGAACPCASLGVVPAAGVPHIWPWSSVLSARATEAA